MTNPQIARRCPACGATIRVRALFCPQCGRDVRRGKKKGSRVDTKQHMPLTTKVPSETPTPELSSFDRAEATDLGSRGEPAARHTDMKVTRSLYGSSATRPPGRETDLIDRVQRIRRISGVVLDEAAYDPSLRFLLVAIALFLLFLLILLLNKVIG